MRWLTSRVLELVALIAPIKPHVVVSGFPADEGNAVEVVLGLTARYRGHIYWLVDERDIWAADRSLNNVTIIPKLSIRGMYKYVTAETVFFTHGLYGDTRPQRARTFVNLWHGDGFKVKKDAEGSKRSLYPANFTVGCTRLLTTRRAEDFKMGTESILHVGNPRMDQFYRPMPKSARTQIGLGPDDKYVVWMPTFRANHGAGVTKGWSDVSDNSPNPNELMTAVAERLDELGFTVIAKPHPQDRDSRTVPRTTVVDNGDLSAAGTTLYTLLGGAHAIITDYSSVWTEYLAMDRPIGFVVPDRKEYVAARGLYPPDLFDWLPGPMLEVSGPINTFVDQLVDADDETSRRARISAGERLGLRHGSGNSTNNLLDTLDGYGCFRRSGGLKDRTDMSSDAQRVVAIKRKFD